MNRWANYLSLVGLMLISGLAGFYWHQQNLSIAGRWQSVIQQPDCHWSTAPRFPIRRSRRAATRYQRMGRQIAGDQFLGNLVPALS